MVKLEIVYLWVYQFPVVDSSSAAWWYVSECIAAAKMQDIQGSIHLKCTLTYLWRVHLLRISPKDQALDWAPGVWLLYKLWLCWPAQFQKGLQRSSWMASLRPLDGANHAWNCHYLKEFCRTICPQVENEYHLVGYIIPCNTPLFHDKYIYIYVF